MTWTTANMHMQFMHVPQEPHTNWDGIFLCILPYLNISDFSCLRNVLFPCSLSHKGPAENARPVKAGSYNLYYHLYVYNESWKQNVISIVYNVSIYTVTPLILL